MNMYGWARKWLAEQWAERQPRTRHSAVERMAELVVLAADATTGQGRTIEAYVWSRSASG
jgi:hypothetical protein